MGIKQVYTIGGNVCTLGGYAMGPTALPDPKTKTLYIATDSTAYTASASAYVNGNFVTSWTASNGSASASAMVGPYQDVVVVTETNRREGYSANVSSTGYTMSPQRYTNSGTYIMSGTAKFSGTDTPYISSKGMGGQMIITGYGGTIAYYYANGGGSSYNGPVKKDIWFMGSLRCSNSVSAGTTPFAFKTAYTGGDTNWMSAKYSAYKYALDLGAFYSLKLSATVLVTPTATASLQSIDMDFYQYTSTAYGNTRKTLWDSSFYRGNYQQGLTYTVVMSGSPTVGTSTAYQNPYIQIASDHSASAYVTPISWVYSGWLK